MQDMMRWVAVWAVIIGAVLICAAVMNGAVRAQSPCGPEQSWQAPRLMAPTIEQPMGGGLRMPLACVTIGGVEQCY